MSWIFLSVILILLGPGYVLWLRIRTGQLTRSAFSCQEMPFIDVIVPLKDERTFVEEKLHNLKSLNYPEDRVRFWLVDGASRDGSTISIRNFAEENEQFNLLEFPRSDKTAQLNYALPFCKGQWILVTDADALLPSLMLSEMVRAGEERRDRAVVGALVKPHDAMKVEQWHWKFSNWLRYEESKIGLASFVTAPCYLFRRTLLESFPQNTISDDIHAALLALRYGHEVVVIPPFVTELRSPATFRQLFFHKWRKSRAYFREIFRFLPGIFRMPSKSRLIFFWRAAQMIFLPPLTLLTTLLLIFEFGILPFLLALSLLGTVVSLSNKSVWSFLSCLALTFLWLVVLPVSLFTLPFVPQTSCFTRVGTIRPETEPDTMNL